MTDALTEQEKADAQQFAAGSRDPLNVAAEEAATAKKAAAEKAAAKKAAAEAAATEKATQSIQGEGNIRVILPRLQGSDDQNVEVGINGKFFILKRGVPIDVSPEVAEVLVNAASAEMQYHEMAEAIR